MNKVLKILFGRTFLFLIAIFIQVMFLFFLITSKQYSSIFIYTLIGILSGILSAYIINSKSKDSFKITWIYFILLFPAFGSLFYIYTYSQGWSRKWNKKIQNTRKIINEFIESKQNWFSHKKYMIELKKENKEIYQLANYIYQSDNYPLYRNTKINYYCSGEHVFSQILEDLGNAKKFIFIEYFIIKNGDFWNSILKILRQKVKEGIEVFLIYDGMIEISCLSSSYKKELESYGIKVLIFNPIMPTLSTIQNYRDHRKLIIIDNEIGFTGGINLADEYINRIKRFGYWKDNAIRLEGEAVNSLTLIFSRAWNTNKSKEEIYQFYQKYLIQNNKIKNNSYILPYGTNPLDGEPVGERIYQDILNTAKDYVYIMTPYLILDETMISTLCYTAKKGVCVKIIMPGIPDKKYAFWLAHTYYQELLDYGIEIYQYDKGFVHTKMVISDNNEAITGSINFDYRSFYLNFENAVYLYKDESISDMKLDFLQTLKDCTKIKKEYLKNLPIYEKIFGKIFRLFAPLM